MFEVKCFNVFKSDLKSALLKASSCLQEFYV